MFNAEVPAGLLIYLNRVVFAVLVLQWVDYTLPEILLNWIFKENRQPRVSRM